MLTISGYDAYRAIAGRGRTHSLPYGDPAEIGNGLIAHARRAVRLAGLHVAGGLLRGGTPSPGRPHRIVLIRPDHLGDLVFVAPALRRLRTAVPNAHLAMLVGPWGREIAERLPEIDEVLTCPFPWFDRRPKGNPLEPYRVLLEEAKYLRAHAFDTAVVLRFDHWWGALLAMRAGITRRIGYDIPECVPFLTRAVPYQPGLPEAVQNARLVQLGFGHDLSFLDPETDTLALTLNDADRAAAGRLMPPDGRPIVAMHVGAGAPVKLWPPDHFARLGNLLQERYSVRLALTGSAAELPLIEAVEQGLGEPPTRIVGRPLAMLAAALERCALVIGADSGVLHVAVAVGTPTVHLYGPVDAATFGPWGPPERHRVVKAALACIPCNRLDYLPDDLPAHPCIRMITVESVLEAAAPLLPPVEARR